MAFENYDANFSAVLPRMRSVAAISADVELWRSGRATDITRSQVATIELQIRTADELYQRRQYDPALQQFRQARASIYALLYPGFDVSAYGTATDRSLPVSATLEPSLIDLSLRLTDSMRPLTIESTTLTRIVASEPVPATLAHFMQTGFRESQSGRGPAAGGGRARRCRTERRQAGSGHRRHVPGPRGGQRQPLADPALLAAVHLNLASAFVQAGTPDKASSSRGLRKSCSGPRKISLGSRRRCMERRSRRKGRRPARRQAAILTGGGSPRYDAGQPNQDRRPGECRCEVDPPAPAPILSSRQTAASVVFEQTSVLATRDLQTLQPILQKDATTLMLRVPGRADGWSSVPVASDPQRQQLAKPWQVCVPAGESVATFKWPAIQFQPRTRRQPDLPAANCRRDAAQLDWHITDTTTTTFYLTQLYAYSLAVKIGDCYHKLGQFRMQNHTINRRSPTRSSTQTSRRPRCGFGLPETPSNGATRFTRTKTTPAQPRNTASSSMAMAPSPTPSSIPRRRWRRPPAPPRR